MLSFTENFTIFGSNAKKKKKKKKKLNTCRDSKLRYTRRRSLGDYIQHYIKYTTLNLSIK